MAKKVYNLIIVDESGSMSIIQKEALAGMNETLSTILKAQENYPDMEQHVTLLTFDSGHKTYKFDNVTGKEIRVLGASEYNPGGATPLYDAIGMAATKLYAQVEKDSDVLVTIITDGEENCSREWSLSMVKNLIEKLKCEKWTFTFIGTEDLNVETMANDMGITEHFSFRQDQEGTRRMFLQEQQARMEYYDRKHRNEEERRGGFFRGRERSKR